MLYLDKDALDKAKTNYSTYAQDMKTLKTKLESAVDDIRSGWKSDAGDALEDNQRSSMECGNMDKYEINSKLYVKPTKNRLIVKFFLNIILFGISIFTLFYIIFEGFSLTRIGELCLAILVVSYYNMEAKPNYQFSILNLSVCNDKIEFTYNSIKRGKYTGVGNTLL